METKRVGARGDRCSCDIGVLPMDEKRSSGFRMLRPHADSEMTVRHRRARDSLALESSVATTCVEFSI